MRIVVVEDDFHQREWLAEKLRATLRADVDKVSSFGEFCRRFNDFERDPPDHFVVDVMLVTDVPTEEDDKSELYDDSDEMVDDVEDLRQGLDVVRMIRESSALRHVPATLYTVLTEQDLPKDVVFTPKEDNIASLASEIRRQRGMSR
jgi:hypothetical protein